MGNKKSPAGGVDVRIVVAHFGAADLIACDHFATPRSVSRITYVQARDGMQVSYVRSMKFDEADQIDGALSSPILTSS
jgi:hypothetical protein